MKNYEVSKEVEEFVNTYCEEMFETQDEKNEFIEEYEVTSLESVCVSAKGESSMMNYANKNGFDNSITLFDFIVDADLVVEFIDMFHGENLVSILDNNTIIVRY